MANGCYGLLHILNTPVLKKMTKIKAGVHGEVMVRVIDGTLVLSVQLFLAEVH